MTEVRYPFPTELADREAEFDEERPDALGLTADPSFARDLFGWILVVVSAVSLVTATRMVRGGTVQVPTMQGDTVVDGALPLAEAVRDMSEDTTVTYLLKEE